MIRAGLLILFVALAAGCAAHGVNPVRYDFDSIDAARVPAGVRLDATIYIADVTAPSWLRTSALVYRLEYEMPARPRAYALSQWVAPPAELLTLRLRELISSANSGVTLSGMASDTAGYRLELALERFSQEFSSPHESRCFVTVSATLVGADEQILAQRTFETERPAPSADAAGGVDGLVKASDAELDQILAWVRSTIGGRSGPDSAARG
jgi:cholesterol transport system auxiliary component